MYKVPLLERYFDTLFAEFYYQAKLAKYPYDRLMKFL